MSLYITRNVAVECRVSWSIVVRRLKMSAVVWDVVSYVAVNVVCRGDMRRSTHDATLDIIR